MMHAHISKKKAVPWWAMIGAPLLGVPLIVALLALVSSGEQAVADQPDLDFAVEEVEMEPITLPLNTQAARLVRDLPVC